MTTCFDDFIKDLTHDSDCCPDYDEVCFAVLDFLIDIKEHEGIDDRLDEAEEFNKEFFEYLKAKVYNKAAKKLADLTYDALCNEYNRISEEHESDEDDHSWDDI